MMIKTNQLLFDFLVLYKVLKVLYRSWAIEHGNFHILAYMRPFNVQLWKCYFNNFDKLQNKSISNKVTASFLLLSLFNWIYWQSLLNIKINRSSSQLRSFIYCTLEWFGRNKTYNTLVCYLLCYKDWKASLHKNPMQFTWRVGTIAGRIKILRESKYNYYILLLYFPSRCEELIIYLK